MASYARLQNAAAAVAVGAELNVLNETAVSFQITGTFVGTVSFEGSVDGTNFVPIEASPLGGGPPSVSATAPGVWQADCSALMEVRANITARASGTITVDALATEGGVEESDANYARISAPQFTRPGNTTTYASGQLVANSTVAGSVVPLAFPIARILTGNGVIKRARIKKSSNTITVSQFRLHLYSVAPTVTNGDGGVWLSSQAANYLGSIDINADRAFNDPGAAGWGAPANEIVYRPAAGIIYGLLEARAAYAPANAETFDVSLDVLQS